MEALKKFVGKKLKSKNQKEIENLINNFKFKYDYLPEDLEGFDELDLVFECSSSQDFHFILAIFKGEIQRMMLVKADKENPEKIEAPTEEEVRKFLEEYGKELEKFLEEL